MNQTKKKTFGIILMVIFIVFNLIHIYWPIHLIIEDIKLGAVHGTNIEMGALIPWLIELFSIPFVIAHLVYYLMFNKVKYIHKPDLIIFLIYLFQVGLFNILLAF